MKYFEPAEVHNMSSRSLDRLDVTFADVADIAEDLKVFEYRLAAFAPGLYMINVQTYAISWDRPAHSATSAVAH